MWSLLMIKVFWGRIHLSVNMHIVKRSKHSISFISLSIFKSLLHESVHYTCNALWKWVCCLNFTQYCPIRLDAHSLYTVTLYFVHCTLNTENRTLCTTLHTRLHTTLHTTLNNTLIKTLHTTLHTTPHTTLHTTSHTKHHTALHTKHHTAMHTMLYSGPHTSPKMTV